VHCFDLSVFSVCSIHACNSRVVSKLGEKFAKDTCNFGCSFVYNGCYVI